jgi:4'-phosphopantetheinyl transferase
VPPVALRPGCAQIWTASTGAVSPADADRQLATLSEGERARHDARRNPTRRAEYRVAHALLRSCLSQYLGGPAEHWRFEVGAHGRPELVDSPHAGRVRFSLSHTSGFVACAVVLEHAIGIDVELGQRARMIEKIAQRMFTQREREDVLARQGAERHARFLEYWTLKEAHLKAIGTGMTAPMRGLDFSLDAAASARVVLGPAFEGEGTGWQYLRSRCGEAHQLAVAVHSAEPIRFELTATQA